MSNLIIKFCIINLKLKQLLAQLQQLPLLLDFTTFLYKMYSIEKTKNQYSPTLKLFFFPYNKYEYLSHVF